MTEGETEFVGRESTLDMVRAFILGVVRLDKVLQAGHCNDGKAIMSPHSGRPLRYGCEMMQINLLTIVFFTQLLRMFAVGKAVRSLSLSVVMTLGTLVPFGAAAEPIKLMVLGDSLVAGHGLPQGDAFPDILEQALRDKGHDVVLLNAGVSGDTTAGGLARLEWSLGDNPDAMIIVLGGNDLLRGLEPASTRQNIAAIIAALQDRKIPVMLAGMQAPRNLGAQYAAEFDGLYREIGADKDVVFYPFFLDGVALQAELNQPDGLHPNLAGVREITRRILPYADQLLGRVTDGAS